MGLRAVVNPAAGGQPGSFTTLTVTGAATIGGGLAVTGSISATDNIINTRSGNSLITNETTVNGAHSEIVVKGPNSVGTARQANMGLNRFADDVWSLSNGTTEYLRVNLVSGGLTVTGSISASTGVSLGVNAPLQFTAGSGTAPYLQHTSNTLDVKQGTSGLRVLNNAGTVALLGMTDGATTQMSVTGSISATAGVEGADFRAYTADNAAGGAGVNTASVAFANGGTVKARIRSAVYGDGYMAFHVNDDTEQMRLTNGGLAVTGSISATDYIAGAEQTPPSAPAANGYRIFAQDNGAGKTQLMVIFASGAAQQIAIEP